MLKRREFLRATLVSAGAVAAGCSDDDIPPQRTPRVLTPGEAFFPQSVASGDPRPEGVVLWTRVEDPAASGDVEVELEVSTDPAFETLVDIGAVGGRLALLAEAGFDHCVKARVTGLSPGTVYHYRFIYLSGGTSYVSRVGRTKTAPAPDADVPVQFAYVSCQDYIGRYFNGYLALAALDIDFFVHLGDYIYETTGDPSFQALGGRRVAFDDAASAIPLGSGDTAYFAASSLDNYRQLYRTYRADEALQALHERAPMIAIWDDHEYSNDAHGAVAAYTAGREDETNEPRKKNANQAWFEYMPVDYAGDEDFRYDPAAPYPGDLRIYRDFTYGKHLHLVMTDLRSYRADHLVPEDGFPGAIVADEPTLVAALGSVPAIASPYVDIAAYDGGIYRDALIALAETAGYDPAVVSGDVSVPFINAAITELPPAQQPPPIDATDVTLARGFAWLDLGKRGYFDIIGARYLVIKDTFDVVSAILYAETGGASETVMGEAQEAWFLDTMRDSPRTWKVWGNEFCLTPLQVDLRGFPSLPEPFRRQFYLNADAWDGSRNRRSALIEALAGMGNVVAITGDVHAFYASTPTVNDDPATKIVEFVTSSISSTTFRDELEAQVAGDPTLASIPEASLLAGNIDALLESAANPHLGYANSKDHGFAVVLVGATELVTTYHQLPAETAFEDYTGREAELTAQIEVQRFRTVAGEHELYKDEDGTWKKWDQVTQTFG